MKFKTFMAEFNFRFIVVATVTVLLLLVVLSAVGYFSYLAFPVIKDRYAVYNVSGKVLEYGSQASIPDFRLDNGSAHLYSVYNGSYLWEGLDKGEEISFEIPDSRKV